MSGKTSEECELMAGVVLGNLQNAGFGPLDVVQTLVILSAYMIERARKPDVPQERALDNFCATLREFVQAGTS